MIAYNAIDACGNAATQVTRTANVVDTTPPELTVTVDPNTLWPPNHKMVKIIPTVTASDNCDDSLDVSLLSITSNEDDNGLGDGDKSDDIQIGEDGSISLRAERSGLGDGRIYTIIYQATDASGNIAEATATVRVPHNKP